MYCSKCGFLNNNGEKYCKNCGILLEENQVQQPTTNNVDNQQFQNNTGNLSSTYVNNAINPNMKKWAILSIIIPAIAIVWYLFIGLSVYIAVIIAAVGFSFAKKGEVSDKKLALVGKILNGILVGLAIVMLILIYFFQY